MSTKQLFATGLLALAIVASVAFMPVNAENKNSGTSAVSHSGTISSPLNSSELPDAQVRDLTYN